MTPNPEGSSCEYHRLLRVARGAEPADLVLRNGMLANVLTRELHPATVGICGATIAYVTAPDDTRCAGHTIIDATSKTLAPGLIDSHMHIESTHVTPAHFANAVLPLGVTTVAQDPHEMANVLGVEGVTYMRHAARGLPLRVLTFIPTCVPAVPGLETAGAEFTAREVAALLDDPDGQGEIIGLAEVMDYWGVVRQISRITEIVKTGRERHVILTGHVRFEDLRDLNAYLASGIESDHGRMTPELIETYARLGMIVEVCCAPHRDNIAEAVAVWKHLGSLETVVFVTDDVSPNELTAEGHLDRGVRRAITLGMDPVDAIRAASLLPARRLRRRDLGAIAPGFSADLIVLNDLPAFDIHLTIASGNIVAREGAMVTPARSAVPPPAKATHSIHLVPPAPGDFTLEGLDSAELPIITERGKGMRWQSLPPHATSPDWQTHPELALVSIRHRHGRNTNAFNTLIAETGLREGALASTYAHDCHNLIVIGRNVADMATATHTLIACGGGYVAVSGGEVRALAALPIGGILAEKPVAELAQDFDAFVRAAQALGVMEDPITLLSSLPLPVSPGFRPTDMGLVDVARQEFVVKSQT
ncbi:MAG: adenine deaminase [Anaerolineae bacterium]|nr:adenine deaminase [Anaerolineae bacterium]